MIKNTNRGEKHHMFFTNYVNWFNSILKIENHFMGPVMYFTLINIFIENTFSSDHFIDIMLTYKYYYIIHGQQTVLAHEHL